MAALPSSVVALTWEALVSPQGDLTSDHFPGEVVGGTASPTLQGRLDGYLAEARERLQPAIDAAAVASPIVGIDAMRAADTALAWAYYRAYRAIASRMAAAPSSETLEKEGSHAWSAAQLADVQRRATEARATFESYVDGVLAAASVTSGVHVGPVRASGATAHTFGW